MQTKTGRQPEPATICKDFKASFNRQPKAYAFGPTEQVRLQPTVKQTCNTAVF